MKPLSQDAVRGRGGRVAPNGFMKPGAMHPVQVSQCFLDRQLGFGRRCIGITLHQPLLPYFQVHRIASKTYQTGILLYKMN